MNKMYKGFVTGLVLALVLIAPACKTTKGKNKQQTETVMPQTDTASVSIPVPQPPQPSETQVEQRPDFVREQPPTEEPLPTDIERLNVEVQRRGLVRDAFFEYDAFTLSGDAQDALTTSAAWLRSNPQYNLLVEGHCDERGTEQYNLALGDRRANIVKEYLMTLGLDSSRIRTVSYGEERPFEEGHDESAYRQNRRAHLVLVSGR
jgi:peptidoglycan-associated lipoprotein